MTLGVGEGRQNKAIFKRCAGAQCEWLEKVSHRVLLIANAVANAVYYSLS
jgi:hypothetical protein